VHFELVAPSASDIKAESNGAAAGRHRRLFGNIIGSAATWPCTPWRD
jgi:hypothetical protein